MRRPGGWRTPRWPGWTTRRRRAELQRRFQALHLELKRDTARAATDAIAESWRLSSSACLV